MDNLNEPCFTTQAASNTRFKKTKIEFGKGLNAQAYGKGTLNLGTAGSYVISCVIKSGSESVRVRKSGCSPNPTTVRRRAICPPGGRLSLIAGLTLAGVHINQSRMCGHSRGGTRNHLLTGGTEASHVRHRHAGHIDVACFHGRRRWILRLALLCVAIGPLRAKSAGKLARRPQRRH